MKKALITILAAACVILGLLTVWTPIPTGLPLLAFGAFLLVATNRPAARLVRRARERFAWLDRGIVWIEDRGGPRIARVLRLTRPRRPGGTVGR